MLTGTCLCGDIAFEVDGPVEIVGHCHCSMCRKFHGSAFATFGTAAVEDFRWVRGAERVRKYKSSAQGYRHFCPRCGSAVPMSGAGQPFALLPMGNVAEDLGTPTARRQETLELFAAYQRAVTSILMLRAFRAEDDDQAPRLYQLVEIPGTLFDSIQHEPLAAFQSDAPVIPCTDAGGQTVARVALDRSDAKITVRSIQLDACTVHAEWTRA